MTAPRQILPGSTYMVSRRCTQRQFLLRPSEIINNIFLYCMAYAANDTGIRIHAYTAMSNHFHIILTDPKGKLPKFMEDLDKFVGKCVNKALPQNTLSQTRRTPVRGQGTRSGA